MVHINADDARTPQVTFEDNPPQAETATDVKDAVRFEFS
jgi:hypothetical protein